MLQDTKCHRLHCNPPSCHSSSIHKNTCTHRQHRRLLHQAELAWSTCHTSHRHPFQESRHLDLGTGLARHRRRGFHPCSAHQHGAVRNWSVAGSCADGDVGPSEVPCAPSAPATRGDPLALAQTAVRGWRRVVLLQSWSCAGLSFATELLTGQEETGRKWHTSHPHPRLLRYKERLRATSTWQPWQTQL